MQVPLLKVAPLATDRVQPFDGERPYIATGDIKDEVGFQVTPVTYNGRPSRADLTVQPGDVCFARMASTKKIMEFSTDSQGLILSTGFAVLRPQRDKLHSGYLRHWLSSKAFQISKDRLCTGATQKAITNEKISLLTIPLPERIEDQIRIAEILDNVEVLQAMRRTALDRLDTLTQAIFLDMFGDPVSNPKNWHNPSVGGVLTFQQYGPRFFNESYTEEGVRIVRITDLSEMGVLDFSSMPRLNVSTEDREKYCLRPGDLIFARSGATVGKIALIQSDSPPCIAGAYFITMRFDPRIDPRYAQAVLSSPSVRSIVAKRSRQAAQQNFSGPGLRQLPMPCPPVELQHEFVCRIEALQKLKNGLLESLAQLNILFASLQHRAFLGEL